MIQTHQGTENISAGSGREALLRKTMLFKGMTDGEISAALTALEAREKNYQKGSLVLQAGTLTERMALVLEGSVTIENIDIWGNRSILSHVGPGQFFAETYALLENEPLLVDVHANENCRILFLRIGSLRQLKMQLQSSVHSASAAPAGSAAESSWMPKLLLNLLAITAHKNLVLSERSFHTSSKTIRGRLMSYLTSVSLRTGSREFNIPFDRQQLADYLNLERSALSKELGKMQREGILTTRKNHFILLVEEE